MPELLEVDLELSAAEQSLLDERITVLNQAISDLWRHQKATELRASQLTPTLAAAIARERESLRGAVPAYAEVARATVRTVLELRGLDASLFEAWVTDGHVTIRPRAHRPAAP